MRGPFFGLSYMVAYVACYGIQNEPSMTKPNFDGIGIAERQDEGISELTAFEGACRGNNGLVELPNFCDSHAYCPRENLVYNAAECYARCQKHPNNECAGFAYIPGYRQNACIMYKGAITHGSGFDATTNKVATCYAMPTGCVDTQSWDDGLGDNCEWYRIGCENGGIIPGQEFLFGEYFNYPERNCCGCGRVGAATETCEDGIQNQDETDIDCGGVCSACECHDRLPDDYGGFCSWSCDTWSSYGLCNKDWSQLSHCVKSPNGKIRDYCKLACGTCVSTPCNPDPCNLNEATGEVCDAGICNCGDAPCDVGQICNAGVCENTCLRIDADLPGNDLNACMDKEDTPEKCQERCQQTSGCLQITWLSSRFDGGKYYKNCCLKNANYGNTNYVTLVGVISGPKKCATCNVDGDCATGEVCRDGGTTPSACAYPTPISTA